VLLDEAVSLFQQDPVRWLLGGWRPVLPLVIALLVFVHCHRALWLDQEWGVAIQLRSVGLSLLVLAAWLVRAALQGPLCRDVIAATHPRAMAHLEESATPRSRGEQAVALASLTLLTTGLGLLGALFGGFPGLVVVGFMAPLCGIISLEGRSLSEALLRRLQLPIGVLFRGVVAVAVTQFLIFLTWINLIAGAQLLVFLARMGTGLDVGVLARLVAPTSPGFLFCSGLAAFLLVEPLWAIQRSLLYLDAHLSQSGIDLLERWQDLRRMPAEEPPRRAASQGQQPVVGALALLLAVGLALVLGSPAAVAAEAEASIPTAGIEFELGAMDSADRLEAMAAAVDERIAAYEQRGSEELGGLRTILNSGAGWRVVFADGSHLAFDPSPLGRELPEILHSDAQKDGLRHLAQRLRSGADLLRRSDETSPGPAVEAAGGAVSLAELLRRELREGRYLLPPAGEGGQRYREGLRERVARWIEQLLEALQPDARPSPEERSMWPLGPLAIGLLALVMLAIVAAALSRARKSLRGAATRGAEGAAGVAAAAIDARSRSPRSWRQQAHSFAAAGRYAEAVRSLFLATLARLDRTREISYRPDRTNGEHLNSFGGAAERRSRFALATRRYEEHWYGVAGCARADFEAMDQLCGPLVAAEQPAEQPAECGPGAALSGGVEPGHGD